MGVWANLGGKDWHILPWFEIQWRGPISIFFFMAGLTGDGRIPFCSGWLAPARGDEQPDNEKKGQIAGRTKCQIEDLGHKCTGCSDQPPFEKLSAERLGRFCTL